MLWFDLGTTNCRSPAPTCLPGGEKTAHRGGGQTWDFFYLSVPATVAMEGRDISLLVSLAFI